LVDRDEDPGEEGFVRQGTSLGRRETKKGNVSIDLADHGSSCKIAHLSEFLIELRIQQRHILVDIPI
jgi:hypothetical protein